MYRTEEQNPNIGEDICETILTIVECLGYPEYRPTPPATTEEASD
jgi:hypothetical protein